MIRDTAFDTAPTPAEPVPEPPGVFKMDMHTRSRAEEMLSEIERLMLQPVSAEATAQWLSKVNPIPGSKPLPDVTREPLSPVGAFIQYATDKGLQVSWAEPAPELRGLTTDSADRKATPIVTGVLDYFPDALAEIARLSKVGNDKHNAGEPLHWSREKSNDHADCILRHLIDRGTLDTDGLLHDVKVAWRALAMLQVALEAHYGLPTRLTPLSTTVVKS